LTSLLWWEQHYLRVNVDVTACSCTAHHQFCGLVTAQPIALRPLETFAY
jgi:hypothetical protein